MLYKARHYLGHKGTLLCLIYSVLNKTKANTASCSTNRAYLKNLQS